MNRTQKTVWQKWGEVFLGLILAAVAGVTLLSFMAETAHGEEVKILRGSVEWQKNVVARTIYREGRSEGTNGMYAIGCVIEQRHLDQKASASSVCLQRLQFSCWNKASAMDKEFKPLPVCPEAGYAQSLAAAIVSGQELDRKFVRFANHYCEIRLDPAWATSSRPVAVVGNHKFYKL